MHVHGNLCKLCHESYVLLFKLDFIRGLLKEAGLPYLSGYLLKSEVKKRAVSLCKPIDYLIKTLLVAKSDAPAWTRTGDVVAYGQQHHGVTNGLFILVIRLEELTFNIH